MHAGSTDARLDALGEKIDDLGRRMDRRFEQVDRRFEKIDERFDRLQHTLIGSGALIIAALVGLISTQV